MIAFAGFGLILLLTSFGGAGKDDNAANDKKRKEI